MKLEKRILVLGLWAALVGFQLAPATVQAEEDEITKEEMNSETSAKHADWTKAVATKYNLTDAQVKSLKDKGLKGPQMAIAAQLAKSSGKPLDDVVKMRLESKMGWGKIAKELGVPPREIGQSISSLRREVNGKDAMSHRKEYRKEKGELHHGGHGRNEEKKEKK